ncbi:hypothetical protein D9613_012149 [Agrocybe pediades]|uniref:CxC5 like cysteine cluster associated with KDZ domain-containing protein n=1 Tax=Agrocybe pediades TaxID=84607 RepID=A0A8H4R258_9AGAR|nr:hypothetical protein D9613_012149 [Agrocybe pediades]
MDLQTIARVLPRFLSLSVFELSKLFEFLCFSRMAKPFIAYTSRQAHNPPDIICIDAETLLAQVMHVEHQVIRDLWSAFKNEAWEAAQGLPTEHEIESFNVYALPLKTSYRHLYPPTHVCLVPGSVQRMPLLSLPFERVFFPFSPPLCLVQNAVFAIIITIHLISIQAFEAITKGVPDVIQVAEHCYMERSLLEFFSMCMLFGWLFSLNCAKLYNAAIANRHADVLNNPRAFPPELTTMYRQSLLEYSGLGTSRLALQDTQVLNGFFLQTDYGLRFKKETVAWKEQDRRNTLMLVMHASSFLLIPKAAKLKFILQYLMGLHSGIPAVLYTTAECSIEGCSMPCVDDFRTCALPEHRAKEEQYFSKGKSIFQLKERLKSVMGDKSGPSLLQDEEEDSDGPIDCSGKPETGNRQFKSSFSRKRTHNEQFIMRPCGIILSRATLFGSESVSAVYDFAKATFPTAESTPELFIYDNSCNLDAHIKAQGYQHFQHTVFLVDVFHFRSKHRETDRHFQENCNPAMYPEIFEGDKWKINTSICEQTNRWLGGYQAILRDMEGTRFNFYLDEMVKRYNRFKVRDLEVKGYHPWNIPIEMFFPSTTQTQM